MTSNHAEFHHQDWLALQDRALAVAAEGITIADARVPGRPLIYVNDGFVRLTGYRAEDVLGKNCNFLQGEDVDQDTVEVMRQAMTEGRDCTVEILNRRKDGTQFWNRLSITPVRDDGGEVTHYIGIQSDVTQRRQAEDRLRAVNQQMQRDLEEAAVIQKAWLPETLPQVPGLEFAWQFRPCSELAGDGLNVLRLDEDHVGLYILDVCGHGVPAALLSASLYRWLSPLAEDSVLFEADTASPTGFVPRAQHRGDAHPAEVRAHHRRRRAHLPADARPADRCRAGLRVSREVRQVAAGRAFAALHRWCLRGHRRERRGDWRAANVRDARRTPRSAAR